MRRWKPSPCALCVWAFVVFRGDFSRQAWAGDDCSQWQSGPLHHQSDGIDTDGFITASAVWTPPTCGSFLVVAGSFQSAGGVPASNIAAWDGASWRPLGLGVNGIVHALAVYNGHLIAGGQFTQAGGGTANLIARFDGISWHPLSSGLDDDQSSFPAGCWALTVFEGDLIVGGSFYRAGGGLAFNIARWNGTIWKTLNNSPGALSGSVGEIKQGDYVSALRVHNNALYIGGTFGVVAGTMPASNIARFSAGVFSPLGSGTLGSVAALHSFGTDLIVGGAFIQAGGSPANHIARWTPGAGSSGTWNAFGGGLGDGDEAVIALQPFNGQIVAGGNFAGAVSAWNGSSWNTLSSGMSGGTFPRCGALNVFNGDLIAAGRFQFAGPVAASSIAQKAINASWLALKTSVPQVLAMEALGSRLVAAGSFLQSTTNQTPAHNIIFWSGASKSLLSASSGEGTNGTVRALKGFTVFDENRLLVAGDFTTAGGVAANRIVQYNQPSFFGPSWSALGTGFNGSVFALERLPANQAFGDIIFAGGEFTAAGSGSPAFNRVAGWTGSPAEWFTLGTGFNNRVRALKGFNSGPVARFLYAGGDFTTASGISANRIAYYPIPNLNGWVAMGSGFNAAVHAIERHNGSIYAAGEFTASGATPISHVARWTGTAWESVGQGLNANIYALKSHDGKLFAAGGFTFAVWDGSVWAQIGSALTSGSGRAIQPFQTEIEVGGDFTGIQGGPLGTAGLARRLYQGVPWIMSHPASQSIACGGNVTFTATIPTGYEGLVSVGWLKDSVPLSNGPTDHGSSVSGADTGSLTITSSRSFDAGAFTCTFTSGCGTATSVAATLTVSNCCDPDITGDNMINVQDLLAVIGAWGPCPAPPSTCLADIAPVGGDGLINVGDLLAVIGGWGACP